MYHFQCKHYCTAVLTDHNVFQWPCSNRTWADPGVTKNLLVHLRKISGSLQVLRFPSTFEKWPPPKKWRNLDWDIKHNYSTLLPQQRAWKISIVTISFHRDILWHTRISSDFQFKFILFSRNIFQNTPSQTQEHQQHLQSLIHL